MIAKQTEKDFSKLVIQYAQLRGWRVAHFRPARVLRGGRETYETPVAADGKGWLDLVLVRGARLVFAELKVNDNGLTREQGEWLTALREAGQTCFVWYPENWNDIEAVLA